MAPGRRDRNRAGGKPKRPTAEDEVPALEQKRRRGPGRLPAETRVVRGPEGLEAVVDPAAAAALVPALEQGGLGALLGGLEESTTVKDSTVRRVVRGRFGAGPAPLALHVKVHRAVRWTDRVRDGVRGPRGLREFLNLWQARGRGLPCTLPLAAGTGRDEAGEPCSFVVTGTVGDAAPMPRGAHAQWSVAAATAAGQLLRAAHDAGLHARDLHPENVLWDGERATLCDLTSVLWGEPLERSERAHALAFFCRDLDGLVHDETAQPLVTAYGTDAALLDAARRAGSRLRQRGLRQFGDRAFRACRHTRIERRGAVRWSMYLPAGEAAVAAAREALAPGGVLPAAVKSGRRGAVHVGADLVFKRRDAAHARALLRASYWLVHAGVPVAEPVLVRTERTRSDGPHTGSGGWFVARRVPGEDLAAAVAAGAVDAARAPRLARALGRAVGRLHAFGLRCRDLKFENLVPTPDDTVVLVDLDGVRRNADLGDGRGEAADLGRLLAAWRGAGAPGQGPSLRAFWSAYLHGRRALQLPVVRRDLRRLVRQRADAWAEAHA